MLLISGKANMCDQGVSAMDSDPIEYTQPVPYTQPGNYPTPDQYKQPEVQFTQPQPAPQMQQPAPQMQQPVQQMQQPAPQMQQPVQQMQQPFQQMAQPVQPQVVFVNQEKSSNKVIPWIGVALIIFSLLMPYISILGIIEFTGFEMIGIMGEIAENFEGDDSDDDDGFADDDTDDDDSADVDSDVMALAIAMLMFAFSPLVFLINAIVSGIVLAVGKSPRIIGTLHLTYVIIFVICGLLAPTALGVSIFDFIGFGFYLGAMAGAFLVAK